MSQNNGKEIRIHDALADFTKEDFEFLLERARHEDALKKAKYFEMKFLEGDWNYLKDYLKSKSFYSRYGAWNLLDLPEPNWRDTIQPRPGRLFRWLQKLFQHGTI